MTLGRILGLAVAVLLILIGALWTFQGLGYIEGSAMSGEQTWAIVGPITAGLGLALGIVVVGRARE